MGRLDTTRPHPARRYNYWLGGRDHFRADRDSGDAIAAVFPSVVTAARANRDFLTRVVQVMAAECGIRQFLDIGCGLPAEPYVHDVAAEIKPDVRVVYADNDPLVLIHARALMGAKHPARSDYLSADLRRPDTIVQSWEVREMFGQDEPVGVLVVAVLHFLADEDQPAKIVSQIMEAMPKGSYLALTHATFDPIVESTRSGLGALMTNDAWHGLFCPRTRDEVAGLMSGLDMVEPGLVPVNDWRLDLEPRKNAPFEKVPVYGALAVKP
jgi:hypothetical protein